MEEKLRSYVESMFENAPKTRKAFELREEIFSNLKEKYDDLVAKGAVPEEAYQIVIGSIGDVDELIGSLRDAGSPEYVEDIQKNKKLYAKYVAISATLYILSPVLLIALGALANAPVVGVVCMLTLIAIATGLILYGRSVYGKYEKIDDTMVEEFKQWQMENKQKEQKQEAYSSIIWPIIVALYFIISFLTGAWYITWVLFIVGAAVQQIVKLNINK